MSLALLTNIRIVLHDGTDLTLDSWATLVMWRHPRTTPKRAKVTSRGRATQCRWGEGTPNQCPRMTYGPYCWEHGDANPAPQHQSGQRHSPPTYRNPPGVGRSVSSLDEIWAFVDLVSGRVPYGKDEKGLIDIAGDFTDFSVVRMVENTFPALDARALAEQNNPSAYASSLENQVVELTRVRPVSITTAGVEEMIRAEGFRETGGLSSQAGNATVASYAMKLAWEKAQLEGTQNIKSQLGLTYGSSYEAFLSSIRPHLDNRVRNTFNNYFEGWNNVIHQLTGRPAKTAVGLSPRQRREMEKKPPQQERVRQPEPAGTGAPGAEQPQAHRPQAHQPRAHHPQAPQPEPEPPAIVAAVGEMFTNWKEEARKSRAEREKRERLERQEEAKRRAQIEKVALSHGYTYEEWQEKKMVDSRHKEALSAQREARHRRNKSFLGRIFD